MASVDGHYADLLAPVYLWMIGGIDAALAQGAADISSLCPAPSADAVAVDLGAGVGMHAIPLAKNGYDVVAIDSSPVLLAELRAQSHGLSVRAIQADLLEFRAHVRPGLALVLCMGDTLTHLADQAQVEQCLFGRRRGIDRQRPFSDHVSRLQRAACRRRPVHWRAERCRPDSHLLLGRAAGHMVVHDVLHERAGANLADESQQLQEAAPGAALGRAVTRASGPDRGRGKGTTWNGPRDRRANR